MQENVFQEGDPRVDQRSRFLFSPPWVRTFKRCCIRRELSYINPASGFTCFLSWQKISRASFCPIVLSLLNARRSIIVDEFVLRIFLLSEHSRSNLDLLFTLRFHFLEFRLWQDLVNYCCDGKLIGHCLFTENPDPKCQAAVCLTVLFFCPNLRRLSSIRGWGSFIPLLFCRRSENYNRGWRVDSW